MENMTFIWWLVLSNFVLSYDVWAASGAQLTEFTLMASPQYGALRLGDPWISTSLLYCVITCQRIYTSCNSVAYSDVSGLCTPGNVIEYGQLTLSPNVSDSFYYGDYCDYPNGYRLFVSGSFIECLFISKEMATYNDANKICAEKNGRPMTASTPLRFDQFRLVVQNVIKLDTWAGLVKNKNGVWMWENGETFDTSRMTDMFRKGQPDNHGGFQNCCNSRFNNVNNLLDDSACSISLFFICETIF